MEHTPGPWRVLRGSEEDTTYGEPDYTVKVVAADGTIICDNEMYYPKGLAEENASLIAAAPELLEVLEYLISEVDRLELKADIWKPARAVITKVKGEIS